MYTQDATFLDKLLRRQMRVLGGKEDAGPAPLTRPWTPPAHRPVHVFGADKQFYRNAVVKASDGVLTMRGVGSNDLLFNFDGVPKPKAAVTAAVKHHRRLESRITASQNSAAAAFTADDADSVHSDAESVMEDGRLALRSGGDRFAAAAARPAADGAPESHSIARKSDVPRHGSRAGAGTGGDACLPARVVSAASVITTSRHTVCVSLRSEALDGCAGHWWILCSTAAAGCGMRGGCGARGQRNDRVGPGNHCHAQGARLPACLNGTNCNAPMFRCAVSTDTQCRIDAGRETEAGAAFGQNARAQTRVPTATPRCTTAKHC